MYEVGDCIVKPGSGVCVVKDILHLNMNGVDRNRLYYLLVPVSDEKEVIYMPTDTQNQNTRKVMTKEEAWQFIGKIGEIEETWIENEKFREQKYKEAIRSGKPEALAGIIKMTYLRKKRRAQQGKKSTAVDERYFLLAENYLYSELGYVFCKEKGEVQQLIADTINSRNAAGS